MLVNQPPVRQLQQTANTVSVSKAPVKFEGSFHNNQVRFAGAGDQPSRGLFGLIKRFWNFVIGKGHAAQDQLEKDNPIPRFTEERNRLVALSRELEDKIARTQARYVVDKKELATLETKYNQAQEKSDQALMAYDEERTKNPDSAETKEFEKLATQYEETAAKLKQQLDSKRAVVKELEVTALEAHDLLEENKKQVKELLAAIEQATIDNQDAKAMEEVVEIKRTLKEATGAETGYSNGIGELIKEQKLKKEAANIKLNEGESAEQRLARINAERKLADKQKNSALEERLAKLKKQKEEEQGTKTEASNGNPLDNVTK